MRLSIYLRLGALLVSLMGVTVVLSSQAEDSGFRFLELDGYRVKWGDQRLGAGASVSYAFAHDGLRFDAALNCQYIAPIEQLSDDRVSLESLRKAAGEAFQVWEQAANLSFHEVDDVESADIILGAQGRPRGRAFANVTYGQKTVAGVRRIKQALICLNPEQKWKLGFDGNIDVYDIRYTLIHEIGHAVGLDHPGASGQIMAFRYSEDFEHLQPGDRSGIQQLYGPIPNVVSDNQPGPAQTQKLPILQARQGQLLGISDEAAARKRGN